MLRCCTRKKFFMVLPFQPENVLPDLLSTGDLAVISLDKGSEGLMVPSKTYYARAAGSALIGLCDNNSEVARIINRHRCGIVVTPGDIDAMAGGIIDLLGDKSKLNLHRTNSRSAAERFYSRENLSKAATIYLILDNRLGNAALS